MTEKYGNTPQTERNNEIRRLHAEEGMGTCRLARRYNLSAQRIRQILHMVPVWGTIHGPVVPKIDKPKEI